MIGQWRRYWGRFWKLAQARNCYVILNSHLSNWGLVISQDQKNQGFQGHSTGKDFKKCNGIAQGIKTKKRKENEKMWKMKKRINEAHRTYNPA